MVDQKTAEKALFATAWWTVAYMAFYGLASFTMAMMMHFSIGDGFAVAVFVVSFPMAIYLAAEKGRREGLEVVARAAKRNASAPTPTTSN